MNNEKYELILQEEFGLTEEEARKSVSYLEGLIELIIKEEIKDYEQTR